MKMDKKKVSQIERSARFYYKKIKSPSYGSKRPCFRFYLKTNSI